MKKQYGAVGIDQRQYVAAAAANSGGSSAVARPILNVRGKNATILNGTFELPDVGEYPKTTLEVGHRILGMLVTKELLEHTPTNVTAENIGQLLGFLPIAYHRRFGLTYTDSVCPASTRTGKCPACQSRIELFGSEAFRTGKITKDDILKRYNFGTRNIALVISRVFLDGEDLGIRAWYTPLTNELAANSKRENFFDMIEDAMKPKSLLATESLPPDYYCNGDGARWIVAEYTKAIYKEDEKTVAGENRKPRAPRPYWKLSKITPTRELPKIGKAQDIWWPEIGKGKEAIDSIEVVDVYDLIDLRPAEEFAKAVSDTVNVLLKPKKPASNGATGETGETARGEDAAHETRHDDVSTPTWEQILDMSLEQLVEVGSAFGGDQEDLYLAGSTNIAALRRSVAKLCRVKITPVAQHIATEQPAVDADLVPDDSPTPF